MKADLESTILHYWKKAVDLAMKYESADVTRLQMDLRDAMERRKTILELNLSAVACRISGSSYMYTQTGIIF